MKKWLLFTLLINLNVVNAQLAKKNQIKLGITVGSILSPKLNTALIPSVEFKFNNQWSAFVEIGFPVSTTQNDSLAIHSKFFRARTEIRYYTNRHFYFGLQFGIAYRNFDVSKKSMFYDSPSASPKRYTYDAANIQSDIYTQTLQIGNSTMLNKKFGLDISCGIGARTIKTNYRNVVNQVESTEPRGLFYMNGISQAYFYNSHVYRAQFNMAVRVFYTL